MELHQSQRRTRISKGVPFSNLTNTQSLSSSSPSALTLKPVPKSSDPISDLSSNSNLVAISAAKSSSRIASSGPKTPSHRKILNRERPVKEISTNLVADAINFDKPKHSVVYSKRNTDGSKDKGNVVAATVAFSCPPRERIRSTRRKLKAESRDASVVGIFSVPYKKSKKDTLLDDEVLEESSMPQDYIEGQRAYFAEIDAYDLAEEVVSESELE